MYEYLDQSTTQWSILLTDPVKYYPTNNGILCIKSMENLLSGGNKSVRFRREPKNFGSGGHALIGGGTPF